jgi:uncharacterized surface protein with fasciclin (FAS1) repeats
MNTIFKIITGVALVTGLATACNKAPEAPVPSTTLGGGTVTPTNNLLSVLTAASNTDTLFKALIARAGAAATAPLGLSGNSYTAFVPTDNAIKQYIAAATSGAVPANAPTATHAGFIATTLPQASAAGLVQYHILAVGGVLSSAIPTTFPNAQLATLLSPTPTTTPFVRLLNHPSLRGAQAWLNNIPVVAPFDVVASNGVIHHIAAVANPASTSLWSRINVEADLTYLKAAIQRADSGVVFTAGTLNTNSVQSLLDNFGPDFTVFAPTDPAFRATLYAVAYPTVYQQIYNQAYAAAITGGATAMAAAATATTAANANAPTATTTLVGTPAVFSNPALFGALPAASVKGIVLYHVLGQRAFSVNFAAAPAVVNYPTLVTTSIPSRPQLGISATFATPTTVSAITVKGAGNAMAFPVVVNPLASSDQNFFNGVLHKINGVLLPQ